MLHLLSDHNFNGRILRGLKRRIPDLNFVRAIDVHMASANDTDLPAWAAINNRILLTHDVNTIPKFAVERVIDTLAMPGVFLVPKSMPIGQAIGDLELAVLAQTADECKDRVMYFPI